MDVRGPSERGEISLGRVESPPKHPGQGYLVGKDTAGSPSHISTHKFTTSPHVLPTPILIIMAIIRNLYAFENPAPIPIQLHSLTISQLYSQRPSFGPARKADLLTTLASYSSLIYSLLVSLAKAISLPPMYLP